MNITTATTAGFAGLAADLVGLAAPAAAAPGMAGNALEMISMLEADGNFVIVNRVSSVPLPEADIVSIRPGPQMKQWVSAPGRQGDDRQHTDRVLETVGLFYFVDIG